MRLAPCCLLLIATALRADGLGDLKAALARLNGQEAVKGSVEHQSWRKVVDGKKSDIIQGRAQAQVEEGPGGLKLAFSRPLLQQAAQESAARAKDPERNTPTWSALGEVSLKRVMDWANQGEVLGRELEEAQAKVLEDRTDSFQGRPARLLVLQVTPRLKGSDKKDLKSLEVTAKLWLGPDNLPLGWASTTQVKASKFFVTFTSTQSEETRFAVVRNRLVATYASREESSSVMSMNTQSKQVTTLSWN